MEFKDYYATLGVEKTASDAEIKRAYRKLARKYHPDLNPGDKTAEGRFKELNEAHEVLGDPDKRAKYDELGANWRSAGQPPTGDQWTGPFGGPGGATYRTMTPEEVDAVFGEGVDPFSDFFHTYFGGSAGGGPRQTRGSRTRGRDVEQTIDLTLEEAFSGTTRRIVSRRAGKERTIDVRIPAGVRDGARVRAAGEGAPAPRGGTTGDLYLVVRVRPHRAFERKGHDLHATVNIPLVTAILGGEVPVPTLGGSTLRLKVPSLTQQGQVFRLRGHGMPVPGRPTERGDLYAVANVQLPAALTDAEREHYRALEQLQARRHEGSKP
jgi:DnaJ-class molecular chaperone